MRSTGSEFADAVERIASGAGRVVDAERALLVARHVRVDPGHALLGVAADDAQACVCALGRDRNLGAVEKRALDEIARHLRPPS
jgi:hypothetical protein